MTDAEQNPYRPPSVESSGVADVETGYSEAPRAKRFLNLLGDYIGFFLFSALFGLAQQLFSPGAVEAEPSPIKDQLMGILLMFVYFLGFEGTFGRTPAKWLTGTKVLAEDGTQPTLKQLLVRSAVRFVPFEPFSFLGTDRGWHDRWSHTVVVLTKR